jgi:hypothetical protein
MPADHPTKTVGREKDDNGTWARQGGNATATRRWDQTCEGPVNPMSAAGCIRRDLHRDIRPGRAAR